MFLGHLISPFIRYRPNVITPYSFTISLAIFYNVYATFFLQILHVEVESVVVAQTVVAAVVWLGVQASLLVVVV